MNCPLANSLWFASNIPSWMLFRRALPRPRETQLRVLQRFLALNARSDYGKAHGHSALRSYADFRNRVPLADYESLQPWLNRVARGEPHILACEPVSHLIPTSGSNGPRKLIPFTASLQREFGRAVAPWLADLYLREPSLSLGCAYWSITPPITPGESSVIPIGFDDDAAYLGGFKRSLVDAIMAVPPVVVRAPNMEIFRYLTLLCLLRRADLRLISIWHPSFLTALLDALPPVWENLLVDIRTGGCRYLRQLSAAVHKGLQLRPMPGRANELQTANPSNPESLWPNLKLISCWADASAQLPALSLQRLFPNTLIQPKGLLSAEAFVTFPFHGLRPLAIRSHFFEFVDAHGRVLLADELVEGDIYEVVVTTGGGLWRYRLHDKVHVTGFAGRTPSLLFVGRTGVVSDRFGEKLSEPFVTQALQRALESVAASPRFAMLAPDEDHLGWRYTLYIEGTTCPDLANQLELRLCENPHYALCRKLGQLRPVTLFQIESHAYDTYVARALEKGKRLGEIKPCSFSLESDWSSYFLHKYDAEFAHARDQGRH